MNGIAQDVRCLTSARLRKVRPVRLPVRTHSGSTLIALPHECAADAPASGRCDNGRGAAGSARARRELANPSGGVAEVGWAADSYLLDLEMLVNTPGGRERSESEFAEILKAAGFGPPRLVPTTTATSILEALPA